MKEYRCTPNPNTYIFGARYKPISVSAEQMKENDASASILLQANNSIQLIVWNLNLF